MKKCVKIVCSPQNTAIKKGFMHEFLQEYARKHSLEGHAQLLASGIVTAVVVGEKDSVDVFIDLLHRDAEKWELAGIEVEPMSKDRDYRGIFRVIE